MKNKIYKLLSIVLAIMVVFSCCSVAFTAFAEEVITATYYISATGSDETGTGKEGAPFLTVGKAITQATTDGHNVAGNTVAIHVTNEAADTSKNMWGSLSKAYCNLIIYADTEKTRLHNSGGSVALTGAGSITFKNIYASAKQYSNVSFGNKNVSFDSGSRLEAGSDGGYVAIGEFNTGSSTTTPLYFDLACQSTPLYLCDPQSARTFKNALYVTYDGANAQSFYFGCPRGEYDCVTTYTKPVNFNIKSATSVNFATAISSTRFIDNGLIQVINSSGVALTGLDSIVTAKLYAGTATSNATFEADETPVTKWVINNTSTAFKDALSFTDTVGVYDVAEGYTAVATKADDASVVVASAAPVDSQDVVLDLSSYGAGTYNVVVEKIPETLTYFVASETDGGLSTNDGLGVETPLLTVNEAIAKATTAGITSVDTLEIRIVGSNAVTSEAHTTHDFKLVIKGDNSSVVAKLSGTLKLGGDTDFENVTVSGTSYLGGYNVNFGTNATLATSSGTAVPQYRTNKTYPDPIDIYISKFAGYGIAFRDYYGGYIYAQPVTVEVDNWAPAMANERDGGLTIGGDATYGKITYNAPLNIKLNSSTVRVVLKGADASNMVFGENAAFQLINSTGKVIAQTGDTLTRSDGQSKTHVNALDSIDDSKKYILHNESGDKNLLDFTSEIGTYKVNTDLYEVAATSTGVDATVYNAEDGYLTVPAGEYTVTREKISNLSTTYYVSAEGNDSAAGTEEAPLLTVEGAINKANATGYGESDTVYVKVLGTTGVLWKTYSANLLPAYAYTLDISSATSGATVGAKNATVTSSAVELNGPTKISNIKIANQSGNGYIGFGFYGNDVELGEGVTYATDYITYQLGVWNSSITQNSSVYNRDINVLFKSPSFSMMNVGNNYGSATFNGNINITVDHASSKPYFYLSCNNNRATYNGNLNINFKNASSITFTKNGGGSHAFGENAAIQIINSTGKAVTSTTGELANITAPKYILTNGSTNKDLLAFTSSTGVYDVDDSVDLSMYEVKATSADGATVYSAKDGQLVIEEAGEYTITCEKKKGITGKYYISAAGDDSKDGKTENTAVKSISKAIVLANEAGYDETDTVEFYIIGSDAVDYNAELSVNSNDRLPDWVYTAVFKANDPNTTKAKIIFSKGCTLGGHTRFESVEVSASGWEIVRLGFHNVVFDENSSLGSTGPVLGMYHSSVRPIGATTNGVTVELKGSQGPYGLYFTNQYGAVTHNGPVTVKINKFTNTAYGFYLGKSDAKATYKNALNFSLKSIDRDIKFLGSSKDSYMLSNVAHEDAATPYFTFADGAAFQFINSTGQNIMASQTQVGTDKNTGEAQYYQSPLDYIDPSQKYILTNNTDNKDLLDFTAEIGTFSVNGIDETRYYVRATSKDGSIIKDSANGKLTVPAGEYTITIERTEGLTKDYYVNADATEGNGSSEKPFTTIAEAINAAKTAQYIEGDIITVKVVGETAAEWGTAEDYSFLLKVVSANTENISTVNATTVMTGDVEFDNIFVRGSKADNNPYRVSTAGYDVTFGTGVETDGWFELQSSKQEVTNANPQSFVINNAFAHTLRLGNANMGKIIYNDDVNVLFNNANATPTIDFLGYYGRNVTFNSNLNIKVKNATSISFGDISMTIEPGTNAYDNLGRRSGVASVNGASQLILPGSTTIDATSLANFKGLGSTYYIVRNNTGENVEFTATAGVFTVGGNDVVYAYKDGVKVAESNNGSITLTDTGAGEYVLIKVKTEATVFEYTNADGTTIADMIAKAINNGAIEGDTLRITLTGTTAIEYGTPVEHLFDVEIISTESTPVSFVKNAILAGDTKFDGVKVSYPGGETWLYFGGHDVEITAASSISGGYYIGLANGNTGRTIDGQTVIIKCDIGNKYFSLAGDNANVTYAGDLNVTFGHASTAPRIYFGMSGNIVYNGRVNLDLGASSITSFTKTATFANGFNIISENPLSDTVYTSLSNLTADVYTVADAERLITFGDATGKFKVTGSDVVRAIGTKGYTDSADGVLDLTAIGEGHYTLGIPHVYDGEETAYADYIDYRTALNGNDALNNFAAKVNAGEDVNVVYYGGSVTAGTGSSNGNKTSWRGIISSWLEVNAPYSKVTNINSAIGGTGSHFGFYRLDEAVLANNPDLLFIEFSINDYYDNQDLWNIDEDRAAMQMESIVRKVRTEAPECDIVIVLTTDRDQIASLQNSDTLHKQARGHYKIANKYGIPTLRVGHALADQLFEDMNGVTFNPSNSDSTTAWSKYFPKTGETTYDIVHPNDVGYRIYGNVVKEFMANSLLGDKNDGAIVKNHTVPSNIVSEEIWAGDPVFIQANAALNEESASLGGYGEFTIAGGREYPYHTSTFRMSDPDAVLKFKFTGTELSILDDQYSNHYNGVNVKIDGGEEKYVEFRNYKPTVLASGLDNVEHTAEVRIADVNAGGGHWVYGFYVRNEADDIEKAAETETYYVSSSGLSNATGTENDPVLTVVDAIKLANENGLGGRDTVNVYVDGTVLWGTSVPYTFMLNVETNPKADAKATVDVSIRADNLMKGNVAFDNISINGNGNYGLNAYGNNLTIGSNVTASISGGTYSNQITLTEQEQTINVPQKIIVNNAFAGILHLSHANYGGVTHNDELTLVVDNASAQPTFSFNGSWGGFNKYNGNLNFIIKDAKSVAFSATSKTHTKSDGTTYDATSRATAAVNVLIPSYTTISEASKANLNSLSDSGNIYYLVNDLGDIGTVNFVEGETGTFDIYNTDPSLYSIILKKPDGTELPITGNRLVLSEPGEYRLTYNKGTREHAYTLSADGELNSIEAGILKAIADGYTTNDIITFYISGETTVPFGATLTEPNRLTEYDFKLIITTAEDENKRTIGGEKKTVALSGPTEFKNIIVDVNGTENAYPTFGMGGNDVTFNSDVSVPGVYRSFVTGRYNHSFTLDEAMDLYIANSLTGIKIGNNAGTNTYNADVNITYNNANASPTFTFGTNDTEYTHFKKNINFNLMAAKGVNFASVKHTFAVGSAIQVINSSAATVTSDTGVLGGLVDTEGNAVPKYIITNKTGEADAISFTDVAGTYNLDIPEKEEGCYAVFTNISTGEVTEAKNDSVTLPAGEYTVEVTRAPKEKTFDAQEGDTLAEAIQAIIDQGYGYGDNITLNLGSIATMDVGVLPRYNFNLVVKSDVHTQIVVGSGYSIIANNQGFHTHYKNVEFYKEEQYKSFSLMGSSATFDKDVNFKAAYATLVFGATADDAGHVALEREQKVVLDCVSPRYIELSSWLYANRTYYDDVTLVVNNYKSTPIIHFNSYNEGSPNGTTNYLGNININIKDAASVNFDYLEQAAPDPELTNIQLLIDGNTEVNEDEINAVNDLITGRMFYVVDKTFERGILEFTDEVGVYEITGDYEAQANVVKKFSWEEYCMVDVEDGPQETSENQKLTLYNNGEYGEMFELEGIYFSTFVWEVRTNEYFEDFNNKTVEDLKKDWDLSSDSSDVSAETEIIDGKVKLPTQTNLKEIPALNKNKNISSKDQYISVDLKGSDFGYYGGIEILARLGGNYRMDAYSFHVANPFISIQKVDGNEDNKTTLGYYSYNTTGIETEGLWGRIPGSESVKNEYTFNSAHTYRVSFSVTTGMDGEDEVAYIRGIVLNLNTNEIMFDETFRDSSPYLGTEFAIVTGKTTDTNPEVYIDNLYFSSKKFRDGDEGILDGDINGDGVYDIRDLVYTNENETDAFDEAIISKADKNVSGSIDNGDYIIIGKEILANKVIGGEFDRTGTTDAKAKEMREAILATTSAIVEEGGKKYYTASNGIKKEITGDIWYVSDTTTEGNGTEASPWTLAQLQAQINLDISSGNYSARKVQQGDAVLFERGSVFRTNDLMLDVSTSEPKSDAYSYLKMSEGVLYGAYGTGAKPRFIDSYKNYAEETWTEVEDNIWKINAPEIIIDKEDNERTTNGLYANDNSATNIVFNGSKVGLRRSYPASGDLYTLYKEGHFTYDEENGDLYIYSKVDPTTYDSIEVSRAIYAIQVNSHENNFVIDNLAFHGFGNGAIYGAYGNNSLSVTNCEFGYSGGAKSGSVRFGNAIGLWCGGANVQANYNWIYQTWDSAISPQGNQGADYTGFQVIGNLFEYNNCDIEIFDTGYSDDAYKKENPVAESFVDETNEAIWNNCTWTDNLMRFTTLGWGSREADKIRGIQGVIRGSFTDAQSVDVDWSNNTIDTPGMEIFRLNNTTDHTDTYTVKKDKSGNIITDKDGKYTYDVSTVVNDIFKFGVGSELGNNTYYFNPYVRNTSLVVRDYMTATPADYAEANGGATENTGRRVSTAAQLYDALIAVDNAPSSSFYWGAQQVTSGN